MKKMKLFLILLVPFATFAGSPEKSKPQEPPKLSFLYNVTADSAMVTKKGKDLFLEIEQNDTDSYMIYSDRPYRIVKKLNFIGRK